MLEFLKGIWYRYCYSELVKIPVYKYTLKITRLNGEIVFTDLDVYSVWNKTEFLKQEIFNNLSPIKILDGVLIANEISFKSIELIVVDTKYLYFIPLSYTDKDIFGLSLFNDKVLDYQYNKYKKYIPYLNL